MLRHHSFIWLSLRLVIVMAVGFGLAVCAKAQDEPAVVEAVAKNKTTATPPGWRVFITFNKSFTPANETEVMDTSKYSLFHAASKTLITIDGARIATTRNGTKIFSMVELRVAPLTEGNFYQLFVTGLSFGTETLTEPLVSRLQFTSISSEENDETKPKLPLTAAEDREDSNIYLAGEITRGSGTKFDGSADIKFSYPIPADFWGRSHFFEPLFDLKANSDAEADPDTMKFGVDWAFLAKKRNGSTKTFKPIWWKNSFLIEAERDFDNTNFTWGTRFVAPSRVLRNASKSVRFYVRPFVGLELGRNIKSPVKEAENKGLARGLFGSTLNLSFPLKRDHLSSISLEASYIRRLLMLREVYFEKADDDKLRPAFFGRNPRDWIEAKLTFNFSDAFGAYLGYEYGQQPPSYKLVDHRMKIGLIYKVKFKKPEE